MTAPSAAVNVIISFLLVLIAGTLDVQSLRSPPRVFMSLVSGDKVYCHAGEGN